VSKAWKETWELESGLPDDFDFWITSSAFGYLAEYTDVQGNPVPLLIWYGESDEGFEGPVTFSLGKGWEPSRDGKTVTNPAKSRKTFVKTSMVGRLIERSKELGALETISERGPATDASVWEGIGFHLKREDIEYKGLMSDRGGKTPRLMPTAFLGIRGGVARESGVGGKSKNEPQDSAVKDKLTAMAKSIDDRQAFQRAAMNMPEVVGDPDLLKQIIDDGDGGFWAKARAGV